MKVDGRDVRAVWFDAAEHAVCMIDQRLLPHRLEVVRATTVDEVAALIRAMAVRGAPTIGATAAYGMVLGADDAPRAADALRAARPTARDLFTALEWMRPTPTLARAEAYVADVLDRCRRIGEVGAAALAQHAAADGTLRVLTHCHAGALATVDHGTALAPFHEWARRGDRSIRPFVWVDETRPRLQGAITAWELGHLGVPHQIIADNASGTLFARGSIDAVIVGADRIARNGDVANKIGTYTQAVLARAHGVPFYVAAPGSTFDAATAGGDAIPIEERDPAEVLQVGPTRVHPSGSAAFNPAFDVTPAALVTGYVTEAGLLDAAGLGRLAPQTAR